MTVVETHQDPQALTFTLVADLAAPPDRAWLLWADPRQLEQWWGPPTWPATFVEHDLRPDGRASYFMTGPEGEKAHGWWRFTAVAAPRSLDLEDGFADGSGTPDDSLPVATVHVELAATAGGTRMTVVTRFATAEEMAQVVAMGMAEGMTLAAGQMDAVLAGG
jgi:uncharacterized protein YndB with AHSA1/START domain